MQHKVHILQDGIYHLFSDAPGTVVVKVISQSDAVAAVVAYEMQSAIAAIGMSDEEGHELEVTKAQRNRFGTGFMLRALRSVKASMPEVRTWVWERKSGVNPHFGVKGVADAL